MWKLLDNRREHVVSFCDRCGQTCDERCRQAAVREQALLRRLSPGMRI